MKAITPVSSWAAQPSEPISAMPRSASGEPSGTGQGTGGLLLVVLAPFSRRSQSLAKGASDPSLCSIASK